MFSSPNATQTKSRKALSNTQGSAASPSSYPSRQTPKRKRCKTLFASRTAKVSWSVFLQSAKTIKRATAQCYTSMVNVWTARRHLPVEQSFKDSSRVEAAFSDLTLTHQTSLWQWSKAAPIQPTMREVVKLNALISFSMAAIKEILTSRH